MRIGLIQAHCGWHGQTGVQTCTQVTHSWGVKESEGALRRSVNSGLLLEPSTAVTVKVGRLVLGSVTGQTVLRGTPFCTTALQSGKHSVPARGSQQSSCGCAQRPAEGGSLPLWWGPCGALTSTVTMAATAMPPSLLDTHAQAMVVVCPSCCTRML